MAFRVNAKRQRRHALENFFSAVRRSCYGRWEIPVGVAVPTASEWGRFKGHLHEFTDKYREGQYDKLIAWIEKNFIYGRDAGSTPAYAPLAAVIVAQHDGRDASWISPSGEHGHFFVNLAPLVLSATTRAVNWTTQ